MDVSLLTIVFITFLAAHRIADGKNCPQNCACYFASINCNGEINDILAFPIQRSYPDVSSIIITDTSIESLQTGRDILPFMPNLKYLRLANNNISRIVESFLGNNSLIEYLSLAGNNLREIPVGLFSALENLQTVYLNNNQIASVPPFSFSINRKMTILSLSNNTIKTITPASFDGLEKLEELHMYNNNLKRFSFDDLKNGGVLNITHINLGYNSLFHLEISQCSSSSLLEFLDLRWNRLSLTEIDHLCHFERLRVLLASGNNISEVHRFIFGVKPHDLEYLRLDDNSLIEIPVDLLYQLPQLNSLFVKRNKISFVPRKAFVNNAKLSNIVLADNLIERLDVSSLEGLDNLKSLDLSRNKLHTLPLGIFDFVTDFSLDLRYNLWSCDCSNLFVRQWILRSKYYTYELRCYNPVEFRGKDFISLPFIQCISTHPTVTVTQPASPMNSQKNCVPEVKRSISCHVLSILVYFVASSLQLLDIWEMNVSK